MLILLGMYVEHPEYVLQYNNNIMTAYYYVFVLIYFLLKAYVQCYITCKKQQQ